MLSGCAPLYQNKLQKQGVHDVVKRNKKFESYRDLVDQVFVLNLMRTQIIIKDPHRQIENDKIPEAEYPNENDSEDTETNKTSAISNFTPEILLDDEIA